MVKSRIVENWRIKRERRRKAWEDFLNCIESTNTCQSLVVISKLMHWKSKRYFSKHFLAYTLFVLNTPLKLDVCLACQAWTINNDVGFFSKLL